MTEKQSWTKEEVAALIRPLMDQIDFYHKLLMECEMEILKVRYLPWWKRLFILPYRLESFRRRLSTTKRESKTIIEEWAKFAEENPQMFKIYKEYFDGSRKN